MQGKSPDCRESAERIAGSVIFGKICPDDPFYRCNPHSHLAIWINRAEFPCNLRIPMRFALAACVALLLAGPTPAFAQWCYIGPACVPCVTYELRPVICYRTEWREEKVPCVVQKVSYRQEVIAVKTSVWVPQEFDQQVRRTCYLPVPRVVERDVQAWILVPTVTFDPCSCCCVVTWCPQLTVKRVRCLEHDYRKEERVETVRVCRWVQQETVMNQVRCIPVVTQEQAWTVRRYCVTVPYQTYVCVPVWCGW
jgi:hypothetical protein